MRRSEITPELIELSKRAKELGFPQDVEEGDSLWASTYYPILFGGRRMFAKDGRIYLKTKSPVCIAPTYCLILSFSRCLEWLESESKGEMIGLDLNNFVHGHWIMGIKTKTYRGKNIHEVGAKAVVMKLEKGERWKSQN